MRRWHKVNLVSHRDMTDTWGCRDCGFKKKYNLGQRPVDCPKCIKKEVKGKPLGWWGSSETGVVEVCPKCGSVARIIPNESHPLSGYWQLERRDGLLLYGCTSGCKEE